MSTFLLLKHIAAPSSLRDELDRAVVALAQAAARHRLVRPRLKRENRGDVYLAYDAFYLRIARCSAWRELKPSERRRIRIADQSRHKSLDVLRGYVRRADMFKDHAGAAFL